MKKQKPYKPQLIIDGYEIKKHLVGGFKIVEYYHYDNESYIRKRTLYKHLTLSEAEDKLYRLENKN